MWELDYKESWVLKDWCFWTVMLEKTLESALDSKEIQPVHPKGNLSWIFIGRPDAEAETPILWPPDAKKGLIWKTLMLAKIEGGRRTGQESMRWLCGITYSRDMSLSKLSWWWTGRFSCCSPWDCKESRHDWVAELNWTVSTVSPSICHEVMGPDVMILVFWMLSFKPTF